GGAVARGGGAAGAGVRAVGLHRGGGEGDRVGARREEPDREPTAHPWPLRCAPVDRGRDLLDVADEVGVASPAARAHVLAVADQVAAAQLQRVELAPAGPPRPPAPPAPPPPDPPPRPLRP